MDKLQVIDTQNLRGKIHTIRGFQVMIDRDLAELYEVKTIRLREQVKRNIDRFPDDFMFQLSDDEVDFMVSQNAIPSRKHLGGSLPYVFTEQGVSLLSSVLRSNIAIKVSIQIIEAFVNDLLKGAKSDREVKKCIKIYNPYQFNIVIHDIIFNIIKKRLS